MFVTYYHFSELGLFEPEFYCDLVYKFKKIKGRTDFLIFSLLLKEHFYIFISGSREDFKVFIIYGRGGLLGHLYKLSFPFHMEALHEI